MKYCGLEVDGGSERRRRWRRRWVRGRGWSSSGHLGLPVTTVIGNNTTLG